MKLTTKLISEAHIALTDLIKLDKSDKLIYPSAVRIKLAANIRQTKPIYENYIEESELLVKKFGEKKTSAAGDVILVEKGSSKWDEFKIESDAAKKVELEIVWITISETDLFQPTKKKNEISGEIETVENQISIDIVSTLIEVGIVLPATPEKK